MFVYMCCVFNVEFVISKLHTNEMELAVTRSIGFYSCWQMNRANNAKMHCFAQRALQSSRKKRHIRIPSTYYIYIAYY